MRRLADLPSPRRQSGQSMVEYTVILAFGILVLTSGGSDRIVQLLDVINDLYSGYSYSISLSDTPDHDTLYDYLNDPDVVSPVDPNDIVDKINQYTHFPTLQGMPPGLPNSPADILAGAISFF